MKQHELDIIKKIERNCELGQINNLQELVDELRNLDFSDFALLSNTIPN